MQPDLTHAFLDRFSRMPIFKAHAPGRVNLLGEHVDYNDGIVLPAAIDRAVYLAAGPDENETLSLHALDIEAEVKIRLDELDDKKDVVGKPLPEWACYPAGVAWSLKDAGLKVGGLQVVYTSDIPIGAGLSSSAAIEVGFAILWQALAGWEIDRMTLARLCQRAENVYVGVACGLMDQFASAFGVANNALYFDTRSLGWEPIPLPEKTALVIADSGVRHSLTSSGYNDRRAACEQAVNLLRPWMPGIKALRDVSPQEFAAYSDQLPPVIRRRAEHVVKEIARVQSAASALRRDDPRAFGALMFAGHASLRDLFEISVPKLDLLVEIARGIPGCIGARMTGGGFGGCTINLVDEEKASEFIRGLEKEFLEQSGAKTQVYLCRASDGASLIQDGP